MENRRLNISFLALMIGCDSQSPNEKDLDTSGSSDSAEQENEFQRDPLDCDVEDIYGESINLESSTVNATDDFTSTCSKGDGSGDSDLAYRWSAPSDGQFKFSALGSDFDTVISLYQPNCEAEQISCNDDAHDDTYQSEIRKVMVKDEEIIVVVDGYDVGDKGAVSLGITQSEMNCEDELDEDNDGSIDCDDDDCAEAPNCNGITCPAVDLGSTIPTEDVANTNDYSSELGDASCSDGGNRAPEATFLFKAPSQGLYKFDTIGSSFDTILYIRDKWCTGDELACDDDSGGDRTSAISLELDAGQEIVIVVDGWSDSSGMFQLHVQGTESFCDDGIDNDGDGQIDCEDIDCLSVECITGGDWPESWAERELDMLDELNHRRSLGAYCDDDYFPAAAPLEMNPYLRLSARLHSYDMGVQDYFEHTGLDGREPDDRMRDAGFTGDYPTGENISAGYDNVYDSMEGLMNSPGHCRNIMDPDYTVVGLGYAYTTTSYFGHYYTQNFGGSH